MPPTFSLPHQISRALFGILALSVYVCVLSPAAFAANGCSEASFNTTSIFTLETQAFDLVKADLNGDGHLDLATTNSTAGEVVVLLGRGGAEGFGPPVSFPAGAGANRLTVADFNGDGKPDLVTSNNVFGANDGSLSVLLGDGSGRFGAPNTINVPYVPGKAEPADFNNDGKLDLAVGILFTGVASERITILLGDGNGGFTQAASSPLVVATSGGPLFAGDFNGDGKRDLAITGYPSGIFLLLGDGNGGFVQSPNTIDADNHVDSFTAGDFNGDGRVDFAAVSSIRLPSGFVAVMLGDGGGNYGAPVKSTTPQDVGSIAASDLNNDGKLDIALSSTTGTGVMLGDGAGHFALHKTYTIGSSSYYYYMTPVLGDFNEDGKTDLAIGEGTSIALAYGDGTGRLGSAPRVPLKVANPHELVLGDFNNDGKQDFAALSADFYASLPGTSSIGIALGDGNGGFTEKPLVSFFPGLALTSMAAGDFNRDGKLDLAVAVPQLGIAILAGDGTGRFALDSLRGAAIDPPYISTSPYAPRRIKSGDFNNDGIADLVVRTSNYNSLLVLLNDGAGNFSQIPGPQLRGSGSPFVDDLALADFDGDGKLDVAVMSADVEGVEVFRGDGSGHLSSYAFLRMQGPPLAFIAADFNGDGRADIAVDSFNFIPAPSYTHVDFISVMINNGASSFGNATNYPVHGGSSLAVGDFNGDRIPDLALTGGLQNGIAVLTNDGTGSFGSEVSFSGGAASHHLLVSDFNSDGRDDVIFSQPSTNSVAVLLNNFSAALPGLKIDDVTLTEGDTGTTDAVFTVSLNGPSAQSVSVNYFTDRFTLNQLPSATKGADMEAVSGTLTFAPGVTTQTISVPVKGDMTDEFDEQFAVRLTGAVRANISDDLGRGLILDNDAAPSISINDVSVTEGGAFFGDAHSAEFTVSLSAPSEKPISVQYATSPGTATPGSDYYALTGKLDFPAGTTSKTLAVPIISDKTFEPDETFFVNLSDATDATISDAQGQATILNDDPLPAISIVKNFNVAEGAAGTTGNALLQVTLSNPSSQPITVSYATADGTATAGSDYVASSGSLLFNPGETAKEINVQITGDNLDEALETFFVNLSNATNATVGNGQTLLTIYDDDGPAISINDVQVTEGNTGSTDAVFTVSLSAASPQDVFVQFDTANGTAIFSNDYQRAFHGGLTIPAGQTSGSVTIRVFGDYQIEPDETFFVNLSNASNGTIARGKGTGTILNDDSPGTLQFSAADYTVNEDGGGATIMIKRTGGSTGSVTVDFSTGGGTATAGSDYVSASGKLTFIEGETSKTLVVPVLDDQSSEGSETVNLSLSNPTGGAVLGAQSTAVLTILDNEAAGARLAFSAASFVANEGEGVARITVIRTGNPASAVTVDYAATDGTAEQRSDYTVASGSLAFAAGETEKSFNLLLTDDAYVEGSESVNLSLSNPAGDGAQLGTQSVALLTINDNDAGTPTVNPIDDAQFFVRQHYLDFLSRDPDAGGLGYWTEQVTKCGLDINCINSRRVGVSAAYFVETEFQDTGSFVYRFYKATYGQRPAYAQFMPDRARVIGGASMEEGKQSFARAWVERQEFLARYPASLSGPAFVDQLLQTVMLGSGLDLTSRRQALIDDYASNQSRARIVRMVADDAAFRDAEYNRAFVLMQYFGYLRRDPDEGGYQFWLDVLNNKVPGNYRGMVCAFITSGEYQDRFSPVRTRNDRICSSLAP